jgi:hypothetical protein
VSAQNSLAKVFQIIMRCFIETGQAPHYTEIADPMHLPVEEGRKLLHKLFSPGFPGWLAGRLINLTDSGVGWNIQHIIIPYHLYKRR